MVTGALFEAGAKITDYLYGTALALPSVGIVTYAVITLLAVGIIAVVVAVLELRRKIPTARPQVEHPTVPSVPSEGPIPRYDTETRAFLREVLSVIRPFVDNPQNPMHLYTIVKQLRDMTNDFYGIEPSLTQISPRIAEKLSYWFNMVNKMKRQFLSMPAERETGGELFLRPNTYPLITNLREEIDEGLREH